MIGPFDPAPTDNARLAATTAEQAREHKANALISELEDALALAWENGRGRGWDEYIATALAIAEWGLASLEAAELAARSAA